MLKKWEEEAGPAPHRQQTSGVPSNPASSDPRSSLCTATSPSRQLAALGSSDLPLLVVARRQLVALLLPLIAFSFWKDL